MADSLAPPRGGNPCRTCAHPKLDEINGDLLYDSLHAVSERYGIARRMLKRHLDGNGAHTRISEKDRESARAAAAIRAWERAQAAVPLLAAREAERLQREKEQREDAQKARLETERFKALQLGALRRDDRLQELDERMARWGAVLDTIATEVVGLVRGRNGKLVEEADRLMSLIDRGVKVSGEVRGLLETDAKLHGHSLGVKPPVNLFVSAFETPEWAEFSADLLGAIGPCCRAAVLARMRAKGEERGAAAALPAATDVEEIVMNQDDEKRGGAA